MERFQSLCALLVALAVSVGPSGIARPCYCSANDSAAKGAGGCCTETGAKSCGTGQAACCCAHSAADESSRELAAGCRGEWIPGCCCTQSAPTQAPVEQGRTVEREVSAPLYLSSADLPFVAARSATAIPRPPGDLSPTRPSCSILYCVWRN